MSKKESYSIATAIIVVLFLLVILRFLIKYDNSNTLLDESLISFFAFSLLIVTSYMQYRMLNIQKTELELQREELKQTREELKGQKEELKNSNQINRLVKIDNMFFQLLNYKESIVERYSINISEETIKSVNFLESEIMYRFLLSYKENSRRVELYDYRNLDIDSFYEEYQSDLEELLKSEHEVFLREFRNHANHVMKVSAINRLIEKLVEDKKVPGVFPYTITNLNFKATNHFKKLVGYDKPHLESKDVAEELLLVEEKDLLKLFSNDLDYEDFVCLVKKYNPYLYIEENRYLV